MANNKISIQYHQKNAPTLPTVPATNRTANLESRNNRLSIRSVKFVMSRWSILTPRRRKAYHSTKDDARHGTLSFMSHAAGRPVASVIIPINLNVHAGPRFSTMADIARLMTAPPSPPPAKTSPFAKPRRFEKYCAGTMDTTFFEG